MLEMIWRVIAPPSGREVRRLIGIFSLIIAGGRWGIYSYATLTRFSDYVYAIAFTLIGILLICTSVSDARVRWYGRLLSVLFCTAFVGLGVDSIGSSLVSTLITFLMAYTMFGEVVSRRDV